MENGIQQNDASGPSAAGTEQLPSSILQQSAKSYTNPYVGTLLKKQIPEPAVIDDPARQADQTVEAPESFDFLSKVSATEAEQHEQPEQPASDVKPLFGKRKQSINSQYSKGSGGSKNAVSTAPNTAVLLTSLGNKSNVEKLKNLKSVLANRPSSKTKNGSATRPNAMGERRPPSASGASKTMQPGSSNMNLSNQRLNKRKNSDHRNKGMNQSADSLGFQGLVRRPPSSSSKTSKNSGNGRIQKPPTQVAKKQNPLISLTAAGAELPNRKFNIKLAHQTSEAVGKEAGEAGGDAKSSLSEPAEWPDQQYLQTMKLRTKGLPTNTGGSQLFNRALLNTVENKDSDLSLDKQVERAASPHSSNFSESGDGSAKKKTDSSNSYSLRARREAAEAKRMGQGSSNYNTISGTPDKKIYAQSTATLPIAGNKNELKQPKQLMSKFSNLMKATKSSAQRNSQMGKINSNYQTAEQAAVSNDKEPYNPIRKSPTKRGKPSPMRRANKSPSAKNKSMSQINLRAAGQDDTTNFLLQSNLNFNFDEIDNSNDASQEQEECQQVNLNFTEEFQNELTLEGISGMVNLNSGENSEDGMFELPQPMWQDNLPTAFDESLNIQKQMTNESLEATLDEHVISIDSNNLDDMSKKADIEAIEENTKVRDAEAAEFDSEIMSIIGSINSRASMLKNKFKIGKQTAEQNKEKFTTPKPEKQNQNQDYDPLANIGLDMDLSEEVGDDNDDLNNTHQTFDNGLDQTIIIGEMEEGNIFDDLKMSAERQKDNAINISKSDLKEFIDDLKLKHRAEIDAIMVEQTSYKKIIKQMVQRFKQLTLKCGAQEVQILGLQKYELQCKKFDQIDKKQKLDLKFQQGQVDKLKIALIEYDRHVRENALVSTEIMIQQLETENAHLRKMLMIPDELFSLDEEEVKRQEAAKKKNMLKSIDDKLKAAEKKIAKKQTAAEIYYQQQREHGFDPFELDQDDYDIYRMQMLKDYPDMPKDVKENLHGKIYNQIEDRNYREEVRRQKERETLMYYARQYGYDINKHQPNPNNGEIDLECLQAHIAEVKMAEEKMAREKELAMQKELLKGSVGSNKTNTKSSAPATKKQLTVETDSGTGVPKSASEKGDQDDSLTTPDKPTSKEDDDDDFGRDSSSPMSREELEKESSNSVSNLDRLNTDQADSSDKNTMSKTLSSTQLQQMFKPDAGEDAAEGEPEKQKEKEKGPYADFVDDDEDRDERDDDLDTTNDKDDAEGSLDKNKDKELSQEIVDKYFEDQESEPKNKETLSLPETDMKLRAETELANPNSPKKDEEEDATLDDREDMDDEDDAPIASNKEEEQKEEPNFNPYESNSNPYESNSNPYESSGNPYDTQGGLSMTLKAGGMGGLGATIGQGGLGDTMGSTMGESMGKTIKGNSNIFGIETKNTEENAGSKFKEFDDLDDDEDDARDDGSDEEPNHDSPAGKAHDKANTVMAEVAKNEADKQKVMAAAQEEESAKNEIQSSSETKDHPIDNKNEEDKDCISDSGSTSSNHDENK